MTSTTTEARGRRIQETDWRLLRRLVPYALRNKRLLAIALTFLVPLSLAEAVQPILVGQAISLLREEPVSWFLEGRSLSQGLNILVVLLMLTIAVRLTLDGVQGYLIQKVGQRITAAIRDDLFYHVTSLAARFFDRTPVGRLITRLTSDVDALGDVFSTGAVGIVSDLFSMLVITVIMFTLQWQLALMLVLMLIPVTGLTIFFQHQFRVANYKAREELSALNSTLQENIVGIGVVQLFRREQFNSELFRTVNQRYITEVDKTIFYDSAVSATLEWIALVAIGGVLWLGGLLVLQDNLSLGALATFILFAQRLFNPLRQFAERFTAIQAGFTALERVSDILNEPIEIRDPETPTLSTDSSPRTKIAPEDLSLRPSSLILPPSSTVPGEICFNHVWFGYKPDEYVLRDLDFAIRPGEKVALVGPTGAGKSSIIRLLCRLYEINRGQILLDNVDVRDMPQGELRRRMAVILQDGFLFAGDVKGNIALGETYSIEQIKAAAEQTNVASFIEQLPEGYDTLLRERGTNLSGGQKQLLAFARAAIRNPPILVLDEATANLDVGTEAMIQQALDKLLIGRTAIIIAHRLSTIRKVDRILVLKQGRLVESGSHEELLEQGGLYASLYRLQMLEA
ncbi:ABC transporter ATP-binding protein [Oculatella sp. FACHB-28]|uniref:ABC transporter ATP-binding protein n=1 Tax=Cyanophyceae TaxID=3028117 RepID=UPI00168635D8|nr:MULTISPECIES: ABC transporter ATP-binding protein [Cyanophyceae]MBD1997776.1 ABC transporter ATP-binding protein [Leptolyngbya sp. FACHB-541]MBD2060267.1 ABC transporter ATP-binding protein [Oculatella sp. FACHB-28]